jgi:hypothetical protein
MHIPRHLDLSFVFYVPRELLLDIVPTAISSCHFYLRYGSYVLVLLPSTPYACCHLHIPRSVEARSSVSGDITIAITL